MSQGRSKTPLIIGAAAAGVLAVGTIVAMVIVLKKTDKRTYTWYPGVDMSMISSTHEILDYESEQKTKDHCDELAAKGTRCDAAVKYGGKVYYRKYLTTAPKDWKGTSPDPKTDGTWVAKTK